MRVLFALLLLLPACSDDDGGDRSGGTADAAMDSGGGEDVVQPDPNACAEPGAIGNSLGVGEYCTRGGGECADNEQAFVCVVDIRPADAPICTFLCSNNDVCGEDAVCEGDGTGGPTGCVPRCMVE